MSKIMLTIAFCLFSSKTFAFRCQGFLATESEIQDYVLSLGKERYEHLLSVLAERSRHQTTTELGQFESLRPEEQIALSDYTGNSFKAINMSLRKNPLESGAAIKAICSALTHFTSKEQIVYRGVYLSNPQIMAYEVGTVVVEPTFLSTSLNIWQALRFGDTLLVIHSKTGKDVSYFGRANEEEILIPAGASFKVLAKDLAYTLYQNTKSWKIILQEI